VIKPEIKPGLDISSSLTRRISQLKDSNLCGTFS